MKKFMIRLFLFLSLSFFLPSYSQNVVNVGISVQEMQNGIRLFNKRQYAAAVQSLELSISYEPLNYAAHYYLGMSFLYAGYVQKAINTFEYLVQQGVADYQVMEQLNSLYFKISEDKSYDYQNPYIFREYYDGFVQSGHAIYRPTFILYDEKTDSKFVSSVGSKLVVKLDSSGEVAQKFGSRFFFLSYLEMPMGLAIYNDTLYVADYKKNKIFAFNQNLLGTLNFSFGETGSLSNQIAGPMGLLVSEDQYLYVVDNGNHRVQKYLPDGTHIYAFGQEYLYRPTDIVEYQGHLYISDIGLNNKGRVAEFDNSGNFIQYYGEDFLKQPRGLYLESNNLYISDSDGYLYVLDLDTKTSHLFNSDNQKLLSAFDVTKDKDDILWRTDFNSQNMAIYTPLQGVYGNISMEITQTLLDQYPYVYLLVRARNKENQPITHITPEEISITEFDQNVGTVHTEGILKYRSNMLTTLIVDRSESMKPYEPQLEYFVKTFLSNNTGNDLIQLVMVDENITVLDPQKSDVLYVWDQITNHKSVGAVPKQWDTALYNSITSLLTNLRNRSVVVFTSGSDLGTSFSTYGSDVIRTYADQNSIPLYVVSFENDKARSTWSYLADSTHGGYYYANSNAKEIINLYTHIKESPPLEYLLEYESIYNVKNPGLWIDSVLNFNRFGLTGVYRGGYYIPITLNNKIDLNSSFFNTNVGSEK